MMELVDHEEWVPLAVAMEEPSVCCVLAEGPCEEPSHKSKSKGTPMQIVPYLHTTIHESRRKRFKPTQPAHGYKSIKMKLHLR